MVDRTTRYVVMIEILYQWHFLRGAQRSRWRIVMKGINTTPSYLKLQKKIHKKSRATSSKKGNPADLSVPWFSVPVLQQVWFFLF